MKNPYFARELEVTTGRKCLCWAEMKRIPKPRCLFGLLCHLWSITSPFKRNFMTRVLAVCLQLVRFVGHYQWEAMHLQNLNWNNAFLLIVDPISSVYYLICGCLCWVFCSLAEGLRLLMILLRTSLDCKYCCEDLFEHSLGVFFFFFFFFLVLFLFLGVCLPGLLWHF